MTESAERITGALERNTEPLESSTDASLANPSPAERSAEWPEAKAAGFGARCKVAGVLCTREKRGAGRFTLLLRSLTGLLAVELGNED